MKKLLCLLAACALLLALAVPAFAAAGSARLYITGPSTAKIGDTVKVSLNISGNYSAHTMNLRVIYDTTSYRYLGNTPGDVYNYATSHSGMCLIDLSQSTNMVSLGVIMWGSEALSEEGELAEFSFEVLPTAAKQTNFVVFVEDMDYLPIGESIATPVNYTTEDLTVTISNGSTSSTTTLAPHLTPGTTYVADNTPAPADGMPTSPSVTKAPNPDNTSDPHGALPTTAPDKTEPPSADGTPAPGETEQPVTSESPETTLGPDETPGPEDSLAPDETASATEEAPVPAGSDEPTEPTRSGFKAWPIFAGCGALAVAAAVVAILVKKNKKKNS